MVLIYLYSVAKRFSWEIKSSFKELVFWFTYLLAPNILLNILLLVPNIHWVCLCCFQINYNFIFSKVIRDVDKVEIQIFSTS